MPVFSITPLFLPILFNCFIFWICDESGSIWILLKLLFLICSFTFSLFVFLWTNINQLPLSWILRINSLYVLFILSLHLFSACFSLVKCSWIYLVLFFIRMFLLQDFYFRATLLLWLLLICGFIPSLVSFVTGVIEIRFTSYLMFKIVRVL